MNHLLLAFYGDDFTGSTDAMESLTLGGVPAVLFLKPPTAEYVAAHFPHARAIGVAGTSRAFSPEQMDAVLPAQFAALKALGAPLVHYKVCSTFDSAPTIGSIGRAADIGWQTFTPRYVPVVVGSPALKRYVAFGNLFATMHGVTYRIDRHPTMSRHPITPMHESDLRLHLGKQTARSIGLVDVLALDAGTEAVRAQVEQLVSAGTDYVIFDTITPNHAREVGRALWALAGEGQAFVVGSSGVGSALTAHWQAEGMVTPPAPMPPLEPPLERPLEPVDQLVVMSGSASPVTAAQIEWALANGFLGLRLNSARLIDPQTQDAERETVVREALDVLRTGASVLMYSALGPDDPAIAETRAAMQRLNVESASGGERLGRQQGQIVRAILERTGLRRACVAGGDTSGYAALEMGIHALEMAVPIAPGSPLCRAYSDDPRLDGMTIALKGGQLGGTDFFGAIRAGRRLP